MRVNPDSPLVGKTLSETELDKRYGLRVIAIRRTVGREEKRIATPDGETELHAGDALFVATRIECVDRATAELSLSSHAVSERDRQRWLWELGGAAVLIHPDSNMIGKSVRDVGFRSSHRLQVLGLRRAQQASLRSRERFRDIRVPKIDSIFDSH